MSCAVELAHILSHVAHVQLYTCLYTVRCVDEQGSQHDLYLGQWRERKKKEKEQVLQHTSSRRGWMFQVDQGSRTTECSVLVLICHYWTHLWLDDSKQVPPYDKLLGKAIVLFGLEGNTKEAHDAGMAGEV